MSNATNNFKNMGIEVVYIPSEKIEKTENGYSITCPDGTELTSDSDYVCLKTNIEGNQKVYIRYFPSFHNGNETCRFLHSDVTKLVELSELMNKHHTEPNNVGKEFVLGTMIAGLTETIPLDQFIHILDKFEIDKKMITAVNDINYTLGARDLLDKCPHPIFVKDAEGKENMFPSQAVFYIFHSIVSKVNWRLDLCEEHPNCINDFRQKVIESFEKFGELRDFVLVSKDSVKEEIRKLSKHCSYALHLKRPKDRQISFLIQSSPGNFIPFSTYEYIAIYYGLPIFNDNVTAYAIMGKDIARGFLMFGWLYCIYGTQWSKSKVLMIDAICLLFRDGNKKNLRSQLMSILRNECIASRFYPACCRIADPKIIAKNQELHDREVICRNMNGDYHAASERFNNFCEELKRLEKCDFLDFEKFIKKQGDLQLSTKFLNNGWVSTCFLMKPVLLNSDLRDFTDYTLFCKAYGPKKHFIRAFRLVSHGKPDLRLLSEEVLNVLTVHLKYRKYKRVQVGRTSEDPLKSYREVWADSYNTISITDFNIVARELGIDTEQMKIIEDGHYIQQLKLRKIPTAKDPITFPNYRNKTVMFASQATLHIFRSVVFGVNWRFDDCEEHENCLANYRQKIVETVQKYEPNRLIELEIVEKDIRALKEHCSYRKLFKNNGLTDEYRLKMFDRRSIISIADYKLICEKCDLSDITDLYETSFDEGIIKVDAAKLFCELGWTLLFLGTTGVVIPLIDAMAMFEPDWSRFLMFAKRFVNSEGISPNVKFNPIVRKKRNYAAGETSKPNLKPEPTPEPQHASSQKLDPTSHNGPTFLCKPTPDSPAAVDNLEPSELSGPSAPSSSTEIVQEVRREPPTEQPGSSEPSEPSVSSGKKTAKPKNPYPNKTPEEIATINEKKAERTDSLELQMSKMALDMQSLKEKMKNANKARENEQKARIEAEKEAAKNKDKAGKHTSVASRLHERELELEEKEKVIEGFINQLASTPNQSQRIKDLEEHRKKREKIEKELREDKTQLSEENQALKLENEQLTKKMEAVSLNYKIKTGKLAQEVSKLRTENQKLSSQIKGKEHENLLLRATCSGKIDEIATMKLTNSQLTTKIQNLELKNQDLLSTLRSHRPLTPSSSSSSSTSSSPGPSERPNFHALLNTVRKAKDDFERAESKKIMENGNDMVGRLLSLTTDDGTRDMANDELNALETRVAAHLEFLKLNIQILTLTRDSTKLLPLPEVPKLSDEFMEVFRRLNAEKYSGIPDTHCIICFQFRNSDEEVIKCHRCKKEYHLECLRKWYKQPASCGQCPYCRDVLRDPEEYPVLGGA